ncbi:MAG TPA: acetyltransferase [Flavisolibacter sp.]|nr:acetyltransferase [Flavisolibacter sp.]
MAIKHFVIFPFNGNGLEALDCINQDKYNFVGFIDDDPNRSDKKHKLFSRDILVKNKELYILAVPGSPASYKLRESLINSLRIPLKRFLTIIHPKAVIGKNVSIGVNCLIMAGVVLTSNVIIGNHVCILPNTVIHHDTIIGDYSLIGSNVSIAGNCIIEKNCYIGSGTAIIHNVKVGAMSLVGLGSNVIKNVEDNAKMVGNPARNLNLQAV